MATRIERARALLSELGVDAIMVSEPSNRRYLTGWTAEDHGANEPAGWLFVDADSAVLLGASTNTPWAEAEVTPDVEVRTWQRPATGTVLSLAAEKGWKRLGFEEEVTPTSVFFALTGDHTSFEYVPIGTTVDALRSRKDEEEISNLRTALRMTDDAFVAASAQLRTGMTEFEFAEIVRAELRAVGSEGEAFDTIVASGPNAAKPHHSPGAREIQEGEPVIVDMGAVYKGYNGDLTRTIWVGTPDPRLREIYRIVYEAQQAALQGIKSGDTGKEADAYCRDIFENYEYAENFVHSTGHGLGLRVHEAPSASPASDVTLQPDEVVTVEPGLYIPGWGGVRIEDVVLITESGNVNLTGAPKTAPDALS